MISKNNSNQQEIEASEAVLASTADAVKNNKPARTEATVIIKLVKENSKLFRRYSYDDNGGGYIGL